MSVTGNDVILECAEQVRTQGKVLPGYSLLPPNRNLKTTDFCRHDNIKLLCDLLLSQNHPPKWVDKW